MVPRPGRAPPLNADATHEECGRWWGVRRISLCTGDVVQFLSTYFTTECGADRLQLRDEPEKVRLIASRQSSVKAFISNDQSLQCLKTHLGHRQLILKCVAAGAKAAQDARSFFAWGCRLIVRMRWLQVGCSRWNKSHHITFHIKTTTSSFTQRVWI